MTPEQLEKGKKLSEVIKDLEQYNTQRERLLQILSDMVANGGESLKIYVRAEGPHESISVHPKCYESLLSTIQSSNTFYALELDDAKRQFNKL